MQNSQIAWELLTFCAGKYQGRGVNHEAQPFEGRFSLEEKLAGKVIALESLAKGDEGEIFHEEYSWIGRDLSGALTMFVTSSNHPAIVPHTFNRLEESEGDRKVVFRFGDPAEKSSFREEITIARHADGSVSHHYAWGMPGGEFAPRSGSRMVKV